MVLPTCEADAAGSHATPLSGMHFIHSTGPSHRASGPAVSGSGIPTKNDAFAHANSANVYLLSYADGESAERTVLVLKAPRSAGVYQCGGGASRCSGGFAIVRVSPGGVEARRRFHVTSGTLILTEYRPSRVRGRFTGTFTAPDDLPGAVFTADADIDLQFASSARAITMLEWTVSLLFAGRSAPRE